MDQADWKQTEEDHFDPWGESGFKPTDDDPPTARPNWWIAAAAGLGMLALVLLVLLIVNRDDSSDIDPTGPIVETTTSVTLGSTAPAPQPEDEESNASPGSISSVEITQTSEPQACIGAGTGSGGIPLQDFLNAALSQQGKPYRFGATADSSDPNPLAFDTSELVKWSAGQAGVQIVDGSWRQYLDLRDCETNTVVEDALAIPGALVFGFPSEPTEGQRPAGAFVAISLGDGRIIDVREGQGVGIYDATSRTLTHGALIPDLGQGDAEYRP